MTEREYAEFSWGRVEHMPDSHRYALHIGGERIPVPSVTGALGILDKPALRRWQGNLDAEAVLTQERAGELVGIPTGQAIHVVRQRGFGAEARRDSGADRGTAVHQALREYCQSATVPTLSDFDPEVRGYVQAVCAWLVEASPEPVATEQIVGSPEHLFAGRFDLLARIDGKLCLADLKTSAKVWPEMHAQMAGYAIAMQECGFEAPERSLILAASEAGTFTIAECRAKPQSFLAILSAYRAMGELKAATRIAA